MIKAKSIVTNCLSFGLTDQDRGAMLVSASLAYMKLVNEVNDNYRQNLEDIIQSLKSLKTAEKEEIRGLEIKKVQADLSN
jgi:hypothetical protein